MGKFNSSASYLTHATGFERIQLHTMAKIIEVKARELSELRAERQTLANKISMRARARERKQD